MFQKGTHAVSVALDHTLRLWSLVSGREELSIHHAHAEDQNWYQLHVDEKSKIVYWLSDSQVWSQKSTSCYFLPTHWSI